MGKLQCGLAALAFSFLAVCGAAEKVEGMLIGTWEFGEFWNAAEGGETKIVFYSLEVFPKDGKWLVDVDVDGFQGATHVRGEGVLNGNSFMVFFKETREGHGWPSFKDGDLLLELTFKGNVVTTNWGKLGPTLDKNRKPGEYFKKVSPRKGAREGNPA